MTKRERKALRIQRALSELVEEHTANNRDPANVFMVFHSMVWFGLNGMRSLWSDLKGNGLPSEGSWVDWTKPKLAELLDNVESVGGDDIMERRKRGEIMPSWKDKEGGEHYTTDEERN